MKIKIILVILMAAMLSVGVANASVENCQAGGCEMCWQTYGFEGDMGGENAAFWYDTVLNGGAGPSALTCCSTADCTRLCSLGPLGTEGGGDATGGGGAIAPGQNAEFDFDMGEVPGEWGDAHVYVIVPYNNGGCDVDVGGSPATGTENAGGQCVTDIADLLDGYDTGGGFNGFHTSANPASVTIGVPTSGFPAGEIAIAVSTGSGTGSSSGGVVNYPVFTGVELTGAPNGAPVNSTPVNTG